MYESIRNRIIEEAMCMLESKKTIREIAKESSISKSTIHKDLSQRLQEVDENLYEEVKEIIEDHKKVRHIRGGESTKIKYLNMKRKG